MTPLSIIRSEECTSYDSVDVPCVTIKRPKVIRFRERTPFDISFLHKGQKVRSVGEALRIVRLVVPWTTAKPEKIREILRTLNVWNFPTPRKSPNITEIAFRFGLQHFYRYCCISEGNKLVYDGTYFDDLTDYLDESGYCNGMLVWLPPDLICDTLTFIKTFDSNIDEPVEDGKGNVDSKQAAADDLQENNFKSLFKMKSFITDSTDYESKNGIIATNYIEAKHVIVSFIKGLLAIQSQINSSVLEFFSKQWLSNIYRGFCQFTSKEAFCMFFNNVGIFQFSQHIMFYVPNAHGKFTSRLVIPEKFIPNAEEQSISNGRNSVIHGAREDPDEGISDILGRVCGFKLSDDVAISEMDTLAMKKLNRIPSMIIQMCPSSEGANSLSDGQFRTISEIFGGLGKSSHVKGSRKVGRINYDDEVDEDDDYDEDEVLSKVNVRPKLKKRVKFA
uniref:Uncharacterized protein IVSP4-1 n=1 Tax=Hyposoter didymator TaxID=260305 RepID=D7P5P1_HYPDD|nr:unknown [Hyposoter didymator]